MRRRALPRLLGARTCASRSRAMRDAEAAQLPDAARRDGRRRHRHHDGELRGRLQQPDHGRRSRRFGTHLVQFQKYEPRFGGPDGPPEERAQPPRPDASRTPLALKRLSHAGRGRLARALPVRRRRRCAPGARRPTARSCWASTPTTPWPTPTSSRTAASSPTPTSPTRAPVCVIGTDVADALFPHRDPIDQDAHAQRPRLPRDRPLRAQGLVLRRQQRQLRRHPDHDLRRAVPGGQERRRRHDPHRDRARGAPEDVPGPDRGGDGDPARAPRPAAQPAERLRAVHERGHAAATSSRSPAAWPRP